MAVAPKPTVTPALLIDIHATMEIKPGGYTTEEKWALTSTQAQVAVDKFVLIIKDGVKEPIRIHVDTVGLTIKPKK